jgi:hypothetical protein
VSLQYAPDGSPRPSTSTSSSAAIASGVIVEHFADAIEHFVARSRIQSVLALTASVTHVSDAGIQRRGTAGIESVTSRSRRRSNPRRFRHRTPVHSACRSELCPVYGVA